MQIRVFQNDTDYRGHLAMLGANLIFGFNTPIVKTVLQTGHFSASAVTIFRMMGAALLFWIASLFVPRERVSRRDLLLLALAALLGIVCNQFLFVVGLSMTSPIDASIVVTMVPIITMLIAALYLKEPITLKKAGGVLVGAAGALLLIVSSATAVAGNGNMLGNLICLLAALSFASYLTLFRDLIRRYSPITLMKWMFLYASVLCAPFCYRDVVQIPFADLPMDIYLRVGYVVVAATFLAYLLIPIGQQRLRPTVVSMYNYVQPLITSLVAFYLGQGVFGWQKMLAAVLVFLGVYIVTQSKSRAQLEAEKAVGREAPITASRRG